MFYRYFLKIPFQRWSNVNFSLLPILLNFSRDQRMTDYRAIIQIPSATKHDYITCLPHYFNKYSSAHSILILLYTCSLDINRRLKEALKPFKHYFSSLVLLCFLLWIGSWLLVQMYLHLFHVTTIRCSSSNRDCFLKALSVIKCFANNLHFFSFIALLLLSLFFTLK